MDHAHTLQHTYMHSVVGATDADTDSDFDIRASDRVLDDVDRVPDGESAGCCWYFHFPIRDAPNQGF